MYYVRRILPEHKCKYCGCMTRQPDSECYAAPQAFSDTKNAELSSGINKD